MEILPFTTRYILALTTIAAYASGQLDRLRTDETISPYSGALGALHIPYKSLHTHGVYTPTYDDTHKYGGIGKKIHLGSLYNHGSKGYKKWDDDAGYTNQGLNKYNDEKEGKNYGSKSGNKADYHDGHTYTRNRGYGYEKRYGYDREYSTSKHGGSKSGHHSYHGDLKKSGKSGVKSYKNHSHKKDGGVLSHGNHDVGKYSHEIDKGIPIVQHHLNPISETYVNYEHPIIEQSHDDSLGHIDHHQYGMPMISHSSGDDYGEFDTGHDHLHSSGPIPMYVSSASAAHGTTSTIRSPQPASHVVGVAMNPRDVADTTALISTKLISNNKTDDNLSASSRNAAHGTPAVIPTGKIDWARS